MSKGMRVHSGQPCPSVDRLDDFLDAGIGARLRIPSLLLRCSGAQPAGSNRGPAITGIKDGRVLRRFDLEAWPPITQIKDTQLRGRFDLDPLRGSQLLPADGMVG